MSKRRMLSRLSKTGMDGCSFAVALPGRLHSQSGSLLPGTTQPPPSTATLVRGAGETELVDLLPGPLGHPAALDPERAEAPKGPLVNKRVNRHAGAWAPKS